MKKVLCLLAMIVIVACNRETKMSSCFDQLDTLIFENPDSAYSRMEKYKPLLDDASESDRMKYYLYLSNVEEVLGVKGRSDTAFFKVVNYYDNNGTANEKLKAHYFLGCIYRDMHEAPVALQCYYDAIANADTLSADCDFIKLMCVWGQIGLVLHEQCMAESEIEAWENYSKYAEKAGLKYEAVHGYELQIRPYFLKGDTAKVIEITNKAATMYKEAGYPENSNQVYGRLIEINLERGNYVKAKELMDLFESEEGFYLPDGSIKGGRNMYYYYKGLYALGVGNMSQAESYFRTLFKYKKNTLADKGLLRYYRKMGNVDSVTHYSIRFERDLKLNNVNISAQAAENAIGMYNYSRYQRIAEQTQYELRLHFMIGVIVFLIMMMIAFMSYRYYKRIMRKKTQDLQETMIAHEEYKHAKEEEIEHMHDTMYQLQSKIDEERHLNDLSALQDLDMIKQLEMQQDSLGERARAKFVNAVKSYLPHFYNRIFVNSSLNQKEQLIATFILLDFSVKQIANLMDMKTIQQVTNIKKRINQKLFDDNSSASLNENIQKMVF